jgi:RimJ/RimL family protein N-acetyltransferase
VQFDPLFSGRLVRLAAPSPDDAAAFARWSEDDQYLRIMDNDPARPVSAEAYAEWERPILSTPNGFAFRLRTLVEDRLIGMVGLGDIQWTHQTAMLGITIGDPEYRGRGYGSDAIRLILGYAFRELNLHRVWLHTLGFNLPAQRAFERAGFVREGVGRQAIWREGQRTDLLYYGMLREEWVKMQHPA